MKKIFLLISTFSMALLLSAQGQSVTSSTEISSAKSGANIKTSATKTTQPSNNSNKKSSAKKIKKGLQKPILPSVSAGPQRFGENFFTMAPSTFAPITAVPVSPDYILGPGDQLIIDVWGMVTGTFKLTIANDGGIFIPKIGRIYIAGLTFENAESLIHHEFRKYFTGFKLAMTMGRLRTMRIYVLGEAKYPGAYEVSSLATLFNVLYISGGPNSIGSMRKIELIRNNKIIGISDLYHFLLTGEKDQDYSLQSGDTIFIPLAGPMVEIYGAVKRPAIYELKNNRTLLHLIKLAGGVTDNAYSGKIQIKQIKEHKKRIITDLYNVDNLFEGKNGKNNITLKNGDMVEIFPIYPKISNKIFLQGYVKYPGTYQWYPGMDLKDIITYKQLLSDAYLKKAEIDRIKPSGKLKIILFSPEKVLSGKPTQNLLLQPLDTIKIFSEWKKPSNVTITGEVKIPGTYTIQQGEHLGSVLERTGGFTTSAFLKGAVFTRESVKKAQQTYINRFIKTQQESLLRQTSAISASQGKAEAGTVLKQEMQLISLATSQMPLGRIPIHLQRNISKFKETSSNLILENGDTLYIPKPPMTVNIIGDVNNPGAVLWVKNQDVDYYLRMSGGLTKYADENHIFIIKADGTAVTKFARLRTIQQGDTIIVPEEIKTSLWQRIKDFFGMFYEIAIPIAIYRP